MDEKYGGCVGLQTVVEQIYFTALLVGRGRQLEKGWDMDALPTDR